MEYIPVEHQEALGQRYRTAAIIVMAFIITVLVYMVIAKFITVNDIKPGTESWVQPVYSAAIVLGVIVVALRRMLLSKTVMGTARQRGVSAVLNQLFTMTILLCVLAELTGIAGLVLYLLTGNYDYSLRLSAVSLIVLLYTFPRKGEWERAVADSAKAQSSTAR